MAGRSLAALGEFVFARGGLAQACRHHFHNQHLSHRPVAMCFRLPSAAVQAPGMFGLSGEQALTHIRAARIASGGH